MKLMVYVKPNKRHHQAVVSNTDGSWTIYTKEPAVEGRANRAARQLLAERLGVAKTRLRLVRGANSRQKVFELTES